VCCYFRYFFLTEFIEFDVFNEVVIILFRKKNSFDILNIGYDVVRQCGVEFAVEEVIVLRLID